MNALITSLVVHLFTWLFYLLGHVSVGEMFTVCAVMLVYQQISYLNENVRKLFSDA